MEEKQAKTSTKAPKKKRARRTKPPVPDVETLRNAEMLPVDYYARIDPAFTTDSLRWHLFNRNHNGLAACGAVVEVGSRILIVPKRFRAWAQAGGPVTPKSKAAHGRASDVDLAARARTGGSGRTGR